MMGLEDGPFLLGFGRLFRSEVLNFREGSISLMDFFSRKWDPDSLVVQPNPKTLNRESGSVESAPEKSTWHFNGHLKLEKNGWSYWSFITYRSSVGYGCWECWRSSKNAVALESRLFTYFYYHIVWSVIWNMFEEDVKKSHARAIISMYFFKSAVPLSPCWFRVSFLSIWENGIWKPYFWNAFSNTFRFISIYIYIVDMLTKD